MRLQLNTDYERPEFGNFKGSVSGQSAVSGQDTSLAVLPRVVVFGCSGHGRVIINILENENRHRIVGLVDSSKPPGTEMLGYQVMGTGDDLPTLIAANICDGVVVAIGDNWVRNRIVQRIRELIPGVRFVTAIHPSARIASDVSIGPGTVIMPGVVVNPGCQIGEFCILNTSSSLDHDSTMEQFSSLAPRAVTGGSVRIGAFTAIAIGAVISHAVRIGEHTVVGAGATVLRNVPDRVVAYGTPARIVRARNPGDPYLGEFSQETSSLKGAQTPAFVGSGSLRLMSSTNSEWRTYIDRTKHDFFHTLEYHRLSETSTSRNAWLAVYGTVDKFVAWPYLLEDIKLEGMQAGAFRDITCVYGYTGPVTHSCEHDEAFLASAWAAMVEAWRSQSVVSVFARFHPLLGNHRWLCRRGETPETMGNSGADGRTVAIDLSRSEVETWNSYNRHLRQDLHRLSNLGVVAKPDPEWRHLDDFVLAYYCTMRRNNAAPFYFFPRKHFNQLKEALGSCGSLMVAHYANQVVGAALLIEYGGFVTLHLQATHDDFIKLSPSKTMIHAAQAWARARGNRLLHLGGGRGNKIDDPLFRFKASFSNISYPFYTGRWVLDREAYDALTAERQKQAQRLSRETAQTYFPAYRSPFEDRRLLCS